MIKDSFKCIAWKGRALVIGFAGGKIEQLPMNLVLLKNISVVGLHWGAYTSMDLLHPLGITNLTCAVTEFESGRIPEVWDAVLS